MFAKIKKITFSVYQETKRTNLALHANNLTFHSLVSFVPLVAFILYCFSLLGNDAVISDFIKNNFLHFIVPSLENKIFEQLVYLKKVLRSEAFGSTGLFFLILMALRFFHHLESAIGKIYNKETQRNYIVRMINYMLVLFGFIIAFSMLLSLASWLELPFKDILPSKFLSILFLWLIIFLAYQALPYKKIRIYISLLTSISATFFIIITEVLIKNLIIHALFYNKVYGPFVTLPIILIMLNIFWMIFLSGVLMQAYLEKNHSS